MANIDSMDKFMDSVGSNAYFWTKSMKARRSETVPGACKLAACYSPLKKVCFKEEVAIIYEKDYQNYSI
jgi:hypothetical protein